MTYTPTAPRRHAASLAIAGLFFALQASMAYPAEPAHRGDKQAPSPPAIANLEANGAVVVERFAGPGELTGWLVDKSGDRRVFYTTPKGILIAGQLFDERGRSMGDLDSARTAVGQPGGVHDKAWKLLDGAGTYFRDLPRGGKAKKVVYAIVDLGCPHSRKLWQSIRSVPEYDDVEIRWAPVAVVTAQSSAMRSFVKATSRAEADRHFTAPSAQSKADTLDRTFTEALRVNQSAFQQTQGGGVPVILYKDAHDLPRAIVGAPDARILSLLLASR